MSTQVIFISSIRYQQFSFEKEFSRRFSLHYAAHFTGPGVCVCARRSVFRHVIRYLDGSSSRRLLKLSSFTRFLSLSQQWKTHNRHFHSSFASITSPDFLLIAGWVRRMLHGLFMNGLIWQWLCVCVRKLQLVCLRRNSINLKLSQSENISIVAINSQPSDLPPLIDDPFFSDVVFPY
jgi:hypothetical protein